jgi:excisionase family DNA binding protein
MNEPIRWLSTKEASERLGVTLRSLYRFIDEGDLVAYKFGRVIRVQEADVDRFIEASRIAPGSLEHLYPEIKGNGRAHVTGEGLSTAGSA